MRAPRLSSLLFYAALAAACAGNALAASSDAVSAGEAQVRLLVSGLSDTKSAPVFRGGIEIALSPGWKTYWRYPGDAGIPPRFDWSGSENVANVEVLFPAPKRIGDGSGQISIGYEGRVIFPLRIRVSDPSKPVTLKLKLDFATCEKLCIPAEANLSLAFAANASHEAALDTADKRLPVGVQAADSPKLASFSATVMRGKEADGSDSNILVTVKTPLPGTYELFAEGPGDEWTLALPELLSGGSQDLIFRIPLQGSRLGSSDAPPKLKLTFVAGEQAVETEIALD
jgi:DsbC/DsbD-like thiol-disulfide interchange protein